MKRKDEYEILKSIMPAEDAKSLEEQATRLTKGGKVPNRMRGGGPNVAAAPNPIFMEADDGVEVPEGPDNPEETVAKPDVGGGDDDARMEEAIERAAELYQRLRSYAAKAAELIERTDAEVLDNLMYHVSDAADMNEPEDKMVLAMLDVMGVSA